MRLRLVLFAGLFLLKIVAASYTRSYGVDGSFYWDVAEHVRDGRGIVTDISMYHAGMQYFPHPTPIYPLWPVLMGLAARAVGMHAAAVWLPALLWAVSLVLGDRLARTLAPRPLWGSFDAGHLFLLVYGLNERLFMHTTRPYTEGIAFVLLFTFFLRLVPYTRNPGALRAAELGVWLGLLLLARSQLIVVWVAMGTFFGWQLVFSPRRARVPLYAAATFGVALLTMSPWLVWLSTFTAVNLTSVLSFQTWQMERGLPIIDVTRKTDGVLSYLMDRSSGLLVAFHPWDGTSYRPNFGFLQYSVFLVLPLVWAARARLAALARDVQTHAMVFLLIFGAGWALSIHLMHKENFSPWNFNMRHAIPILALILPCLGWMFVRGGRWRGGAALLLTASLVSMVSTLGTGVRVLWMPDGDSARMVIVDWVRANTPPGEMPVIAISNPEAQHLARQTNGIGIHWADRLSRLGGSTRLFDDYGVRYMIVPDTRDLPGSIEVEEYRARFAERADAPPGWRIVVRRPEGDLRWPLVEVTDGRARSVEEDEG